MRKNRKEQIDGIYQAAVQLWYDVAHDNDNMLCKGHPGVVGMTSADQEYSMEWGVLQGAITALQEVSNNISK